MFISKIMLSCVIIVLLISCDNKNDNKDTNSMYYIFQGDVLLDYETPADRVLIARLTGNKELHLQNGTKRGIISKNTKFWPNGYIPFYIDNSMGSFSATDLARLKRAMKEWELAANIYFSQVYSPGNYIYRIVKENLPDYIGGMSTVGYTKNAKYSFNTNNYEIILHELGHCLGLLHEHQRPDRDTYINIHYDNIIPGCSLNSFSKYNVRTIDYLSPYDYLSIMHYQSKVCTKDLGLSVITKKNGDVITGTTGLSYNDLKSIRHLYGDQTDTSHTMYADSSDGHWEIYPEHVNVYDGNPFVPPTNVKKNDSKDHLYVGYQQTPESNFEGPVNYKAYIPVYSNVLPKDATIITGYVCGNISNYNQLPANWMTYLNQHLRIKIGQHESMVQTSVNISGTCFEIVNQDTLQAISKNKKSDIELYFKNNPQNYLLKLSSGESDYMILKPRLFVDWIKVLMIAPIRDVYPFSIYLFEL